MKDLPLPLATAGLLHIQDRKLLLAFSANKKAWYLPGGKVDTGETPREALVREILEELNLVLDEDMLRFHSHIQAKAYGEEPARTMEQDCFMYSGPVSVSPSNEIEAVQYFSKEEYALEPVQVIGVQMIMDELHKEGLLD